MTKIIVNEIFLSINGETSTMGMPTTFIRLAGCNLNCWEGCDTAYALSNEAGQRFEIQEILEKVQALGCHRVCLTGGEPLLSRVNALALLEVLAENGFNVSVETNGSIDLSPFIGKFQDKVRFSMDLKPPASGMDQYMKLENLKLLTGTDEIKFIIADKADFEWSCEIITKYESKAQVLFSPMYDKLLPKTLVEWVLAAKLWDARVQLQLHKYIWSPEKQGV